MTTSGTYAFDMTVAAIIDEAAERAGIDPASLTHRHLKSAMQSLNLLQLEISNEDGDRVYAIDEETASITSGTSTVALSAGSIDVLDEQVVIYESGGAEVPMSRIPRDDYLMIPDKTQTGTPSQFWIDHSTINTPTMVLWPVSDGSYTIKYNRMRFMQDVDTLSDTVDARRIWLDAICAGLAYRLADKYAPDRADRLEAKFEKAKHKAKIEGRGRGPVMIYARGFGHAGRRRRV